jgi:hypothetical protein
MFAQQRGRSRVNTLQKITVVHEAHVKLAGPRHPSERANFRCWLQTDIQPPEIEVCFTLNNGHSSVDPKEKSGRETGAQCTRVPGAGSVPCNSSTARSIRFHTA